MHVEGQGKQPCMHSMHCTGAAHADLAVRMADVAAPKGQGVALKGDLGYSALSTDGDGMLVIGYLQSGGGQRRCSMR